jgi:hypothetical protein
VLRSAWDYFDRLEEFLGWVDRVDSVTRVVNSPTVIRWNSHKGYLSELGRAGVRVRPTLHLPRGLADPVERMLAVEWADVVIKPAVDGGARRALRTRVGSPAAAHHLRTLVLHGDTIVQPLCPKRGAGRDLALLLRRRVLARRPQGAQAGRLTGTGTARGRCTSRPGPSSSWPGPRWLAPDGLTYPEPSFDLDGDPTLMELELIEPDLFLRMSPGSVERLAAAVEVLAAPA